MAQCSRSRAGRIGLFNTPDVPHRPPTPDHPAVEERSIALMRQARLQSYNAYRERFGMPPLTSFAELTSDAAVQRAADGALRATSTSSSGTSGSSPRTTPTT